MDDFLAGHGSGAKALKNLLALPERPLLLPKGFTSTEIASMKLPEPRWIVDGLIPVGHGADDGCIFSPGFRGQKDIRSLL